MKEVVVVVGAGFIGQAIARRVGAGKHLLLANVTEKSAIEAAEAGQGFALTDQVLATDSILEGWLVRPFNFDMKDHWHYWIVRGKGQKETVPVRAFREWMMGEIADTNRKFAQLSGQKPPAVAGKPASS
jgi:LysR family glycine cleavage system transcriptional activator